VEYPKNYRELVQHFSAEETCFDYIAAIRWPDGFVCPNCGNKKFWKSRQNQRICTHCKKKTSVLAGTLLQDTKLPLNLWFQMVWWFVGPKNGASALALMQNFGIGSYETAWRLLTKLRSCAVLPMREPLAGEVEVDEAFLGGKDNKEIVVIAAEKRGRGTGRLRLKHVKSRKAEDIQGFIVEAVSPGSTIVSDRHKSYPTIVKKGYAHTPLRKPFFWEEVDGNDDRLLPRVHRAISLLKRWYYGTYQGRVDEENLQSYLDEFVFRFNRRTSGSRGLLFHRMMTAAVDSTPKPLSGTQYSKP